MSFRAPQKVNPSKPRIWVEEQKHHPGYKTRSNFETEHSSAVVNPMFVASQDTRRDYNPRSEMELEVMPMSVPMKFEGKKLTRTERVNIVKKCEWDVEEENELPSASTRLPRYLTLLFMIMFVMSSGSIVMTVLMHLGKIGCGNCLCCGDSVSATHSAMRESSKLETLKAELEQVKAQNNNHQEELSKIKQSVKLLEEELSTNKDHMKELSSSYNSLSHKFNKSTKKLDLSYNATTVLKSQQTKMDLDFQFALNSTRKEMQELEQIWPRALNATKEEIEKNFLSALNETEQKLVQLSIGWNSTKEDVQQLNKTSHKLATEIHNSTKKLMDADVILSTSVESVNATMITYKFQQIKRFVEFEVALNSTRAKEEDDMKQVWGAVNKTIKNTESARAALNKTEEKLVQLLNGVWIEVNSTKQDVQQLEIMSQNISKELNVKDKKLQESDRTLLGMLTSVNRTLTNQVETVSKMPGPIGPPGYNGSQGLNGSQGPAGPSGPKGAGNISQCHYKPKESSGTSSVPAARADVIVVESSGKRIVGATCSTDDAKEYRLSSGILKSGSNAGKRFYKCKCAGQADIMKDGGGKMRCFIHYWECPLIS